MKSIYIEETRLEREINMIKKLYWTAIVATPSVIGLMLSEVHWHDWKFWALIVTYPVYGLVSNLRYISEVEKDA